MRRRPVNVRRSEVTDASSGRREESKHAALHNVPHAITVDIKQGRRHRDG